MKILLIQPALPLDRKYHQHILQKLFRPAPLTLPIIAAHTPRDCDVKIIDDAFMEVPYNADIDLVGVTGSTPFAARMRDICNGFRARGVPVAVGGPFATLCPEKAQEFADSVVIGDAEDTWPSLVADLKAGGLKPLYRSGYPPLTGKIFPKRDLLKKEKYILPTTYQFTRGCQHRCRYCTIYLQYGNKVRKTPVNEVIEDIRQSSKQRLKPLVFWDDNLLNDKKYARELFTAIKSFKLRWLGASTLLIADQPDILKLAAESGCMGLFVGLESFSQGSLEETHKGFNKVQSYRQKVKKIHDHGIAVESGIIFGFDHDGREVFEQTIEALEKIKLDIASFSILTPFPGTELYRQYELEGRILTRDLLKYDEDHVVFQPRHMSPRELQEGFHWAWHQFYSMQSVFKRFAGNRTRLFIKLIMSIQYRWFIRLRYPLRKGK